MTGAAKHEPQMERFRHLILTLESCAWWTGDKTLTDAEHNAAWALRYRARDDLVDAIRQAIGIPSSPLPPSP